MATSKALGGHVAGSASSHVRGGQVCVHLQCSRGWQR
jgi:hypothetical protein